MRSEIVASGPVPATAVLSAEPRMTLQEMDEIKCSSVEVEFAVSRAYCALVRGNTSIK